jgi:hypothetical protein
MPNKHSGGSHPPIQTTPPSGPEIDYSPRTYTPREKLLFGVKLLIITGIVALLLWLVN